MLRLVVWTLDAQRYALPFSAVERVLRAVAITPLPDAPAIIDGIVNVHGAVIPVVNLRRRLQLPVREIALTDMLVLANSARRKLAFFVDAVIGMTDYLETDIVRADSIVPGTGCVVGVARLVDGMTLIQDLDCFLSLDDEEMLEQAVAGGAV